MNCEWSRILLTFALHCWTHAKKVSFRSLRGVLLREVSRCAMDPWTILVMSNTVTVRGWKLGSLVIVRYEIGCGHNAPVRISCRTEQFSNLEPINSQGKCTLLTIPCKNFQELSRERRFLRYRALVQYPQPALSRKPSRTDYMEKTNFFEKSKPPKVTCRRHCNIVRRAMIWCFRVCV